MCVLTADPVQFVLALSINHVKESKQPSWMFESLYNSLNLASYSSVNLTKVNI